MLCSVIFTSLEDHQQIAYVLGMARPPNAADAFTTQELLSTKHLMNRLLDILAEELVRLSSIMLSSWKVN